MSYVEVCVILQPAHLMRMDMSEKLRCLCFLLCILIATGKLGAQQRLKSIENKHSAFWTAAFGTEQWRGSNVGILVVKSRSMLHVLRLDGHRDTVASFRVCAMNTSPGFKKEQGDGLTPEGIYFIRYMNPKSQDHMTMGLDYPNAMDDARHNRLAALDGKQRKQGSGIAIHGKCSSVGCISVSNEDIEKLYVLVASTKDGGRRVPVLVLPFDNDTQYARMMEYADKQFGTLREPYWKLLRKHLANMRELWTRYVSSGIIPERMGTTDGLYALPSAGE